MKPRQVWKFPLHRFQEIVECSADAQAIAFQDQGGVMCLWMLVDPTAPTYKRKVVVVGTGHPAPDSGYVGSVQEGQYIWHAFVEPNAGAWAEHEESGG